MLTVYDVLENIVALSVSGMSTDTESLRYTVIARRLSKNFFHGELTCAPSKAQILSRVKSALEKVRAAAAQKCVIASEPRSMSVSNTKI